jgi:two-component system cell cycle sensor histidine kinase/response regulator CckA
MTPPEAPLTRVLVVDDDLAVRRVTGRYLAMLGYAVVEAADGQEALHHVGADGPFDLVLSDIALPGIRGPALVRELRARLPELRVVLMTGYAIEVLDPRDWPAATGFLLKPFSLAELRACLERCQSNVDNKRTQP